MIKSVIAAAAAAPLFATAAIAGPYVNVETNAGWSGSDYVGAATDLHIGLEGYTGNVGYYIQGGPAIVAPDGGDQDTELSGKIGLSADVTDKLGVYGELSFITNGSDDAGYGSKAGVKYSF